MKRYRWDIICIFIIAIVSAIVTIRNFRVGYSLIGGDAGVVQEYPISAFKEALYVWFDKDNTGSSFGVNPSSLFPYLALLSLLRFLGLSIIFGQRLFFFLMFFISGVSAYYMIRILTRDMHWVGLVSALFYMFNHYTIVTWSSAVSNYSFTYMLMPVFVALFIKGLEKGSNRYVVLLGLTSMIGLGGNLSLVAVVVFALGLYLIFYMVIERNIFNPMWFSFKVCIFCLILNLWWWLPTILSAEGLAKTVEARGTLGWLDWMNWRTSFLNLFRLDGYTGWLDFFPYGPNFVNRFILVAMGYFIPILAFSSILWIKKYKKLGFFILLVLVSLFLSKGKHPPCGGFFIWMFRNIPGFSIFRSSYDKFIPLVALGYSFLIGIAVHEFSILLRRYASWLGSVWISVSILLVVLYPYPFWKGNLIRTNPGERRTFFVKVPGEYDDAGIWLNNKRDDFRTLVIPQKAGDYFEYKWGYFGPSIDRYLYNNAVLDSCFSNISNIFEKTRDVVSIFRLFAVKYLLFHFDNINYREAYELEEFVKKNHDIRSERDFRDISFYSINEKCFLPKIYVADRSIWCNGGDNGLVYLANHGFLNRKPVIFFNNGDDKDIFEPDMFNKVILCNKKHKAPGTILAGFTKASCLLWDKRGKFNKGEFYILKDSVYNIDINISPNFIFHSEKEDITFDKNLGDRGELTNWVVGVKEAEYSMRRISRLVALDLYFMGDSKRDEYIQLKRQGLEIDLERSPIFVMTYMVTDPRVQTLQAVLGLDFNDDGKVDGYLKNIFQAWPPTFLREYIFDALTDAKRRYPGMDSYKVVEIELYPHKKWGVDCSGIWKGKYGFYIANIKFCNFIKEKEFFEERDYAVDIDYSTLNNVLQKSQGFADGRFYVEFLQDVGEINLKRSPIINFSCIGNWDRIKRVEAILDLDLDGDGQEDTEENIIYLYPIPIYQSAKIEEFDLNTKGLIKYKFRDKAHINLIHIRWRIYCNRYYIEDGLFVFKINHLKVFSRDLIDPVGKEFILPIFRLDNNNYTMKKRFLKTEDFENIVFKVGRVRLKRRWHSIFSLLTRDNNFIIDSISITEGGFRKPRYNPGEVIEYIKINPTRYQVSLNVNRPFWLVFSETFDKSWKAYLYKNQKSKIKNQKYSWSALWQMWEDRGDRVELKNHYKVNWYANGWWISRNQNDPDIIGVPRTRNQNETMGIVIEYIPQRWFEIGMLISGIGLICAFGYLCKKTFLGR